MLTLTLMNKDVDINEHSCPQTKEECTKRIALIAIREQNDHILDIMFDISLSQYTHEEYIRIKFV